MAKANILIVEDDGIVALDIDRRLKNLGYSVAAIVSSGKEAIKKVKETHPDLVLMDIVLKDEMDGIEAADKIRTQFRVPVVYLTAYADDKLLERAKITEPFGYIIKPFEGRELHSAIEIALYKHKAEGTLQKAHDELEERVKERTIDLQKTNEILEKIFSTTHFCTVLLDTDFNFIRVNSAYADTCCYEPGFFPGKNHFDLYPHEENESIFRKVVETGEPFTIFAKPFEFPDQPERGVTYWDWTLHPVKDAFGEVEGVLFCLIDVTDRIRKEKQLIQSEKLASMGELAAGVAHEINNPINGIINYAQILIDGLEGQTDEDGIPARIMKEAERIASIVKNMLAFVRETDDVLITVSVKNIFADILQLVETRLSNDGIQLKLGILNDLPMVNVNSQKIQQVFMNLISNARYALNEKYKGSHKNKVLRLEGEVHEIDGKAYCRITFHDTGAGIPPDEIDKVCAPFFTTKPNGEGTGLGLSISCGIVGDYGGQLSFESEKGKYTKAIVDLPAIAGE